jgi:hypothetical protein
VPCALQDGVIARKKNSDVFSKPKHIGVSLLVWYLFCGLVALYWISSPGKSWKVFVANRVKKIAEITEEIGIQWKYVPSEKNVADAGSRGATLNQMHGEQRLVRRS